MQPVKSARGPYAPAPHGKRNRSAHAFGTHKTGCERIQAPWRETSANGTRRRPANRSGSCAVHEFRHSAKPEAESAASAQPVLPEWTQQPQPELDAHLRSDADALEHRKAAPLSVPLCCEQTLRWSSNARQFGQKSASQQSGDAAHGPGFRSKTNAHLHRPHTPFSMPQGHSIVYDFSQVVLA